MCGIAGIIYRDGTHEISARAGDLDGKAEPSAANIKALLDDQTFQSEARERGLKKGLTVAAIDQVFLGIGGKIAGSAAGKSVAKKVAAGTAAAGVDATGEVIGEAASQQVARGEIDKGDALREGVMSLGQSAVEPVIGAGIHGASAAYWRRVPRVSALAGGAAAAPRDLRGRTR